MVLGYILILNLKKLHDNLTCLLDQEKQKELQELIFFSQTDSSFEIIYPSNI